MWQKKAPALFVLVIFLASIFYPVSLGVAKSSSISVPQTDESPLALKTSVLDKLSVVNANGEDAKKLAEIVHHVRASVDGAFLDDYHVKSGDVFKEDKEAAQQLRVLIDREKKSDLDESRKSVV